MAFCGAPGAVITVEELHAMGCQKFIICGGAGALTKDSKVGEIIIPVSAVRDEGTTDAIYRETPDMIMPSCYMPVMM